jgi:signal transduction histidine kinase
LGEILNNLITNAIKYTPDNGTITIYLTKSKSLLKFMIKDTGYGIPLDSQGLIFTKFYRASNVGKHDVSGTGLGLYFTKLLAEKINGKVWFKSREDVGTNFFFTMPLQGSISKKGNYRLSDSRISNN